MKEHTLQGKVIIKNRENNSVNGNPRYYVVIQGADGNTIDGKTASDAMCAYGNWSVGDSVTVLWHETRTGNVVIDHVSEPNNRG